MKKVVHKNTYNDSVKTSDLTYHLPPELIAQQPTKKRGESRLMVVERSSGRLTHSNFEELPELTAADDLFVLNNTRVFPARLFGRKSGLDRRIEVFLLREVDEDLWEVLLRPGRRVPPGTILDFGVRGFKAHVLVSPESSKRLIRFEYSGDFWDWIERIGEVPLPPYIKRTGPESKELDRERYQTIYARQARSVAAPTAGLHFTAPILQRINSCEITLHVGYGTFKPISTETLEDHAMENEYYSIDAEAAGMISEHSDSSGRLIAVGSTTTRTLEHVYATTGRIVEGAGLTDLFIYPGFEFGAIQGMLTNFHLPGSTLLAMVSAFAGTDLIRKAYQEAVEDQYRFYSYGDAMLIL